MPTKNLVGSIANLYTREWLKDITNGCKNTPHHQCQNRSIENIGKKLEEETNAND